MLNWQRAKPATRPSRTGTGTRTGRSGDVSVSFNPSWETAETHTDVLTADTEQDWMNPGSDVTKWGSGSDRRSSWVLGAARLFQVQLRPFGSTWTRNKTDLMFPSLLLSKHILLMRSPFVQMVIYVCSQSAVGRSRPPPLLNVTSVQQMKRPFSHHTRNI